MTAEVIVLNDRPMIKVTNEHGHHLGFFPTPEAIAARGIDLSTVTILEPR
jgi:hypothetical protein